MKIKSGVICHAFVTHFAKQSSSVTASELREVVFRHDLTYSVVQGTCKSFLVLGTWLAALVEARIGDDADLRL